ncbi:MAG: threonine ammonia-lyase, partial [Acetobacteraceae bacterium]|nr:threonine ammonia-lyase [Acetobacteraceae bacterium]
MQDSTGALALPTIDDIRDARARIRGGVLHTPTLALPALERALGQPIRIKVETFQAVASFKERGALNRLLTLPEDARARGVIAMSAGNHAQAVAHHAQRLGIAATIVMPRDTPFSKVARTAQWGPRVVLEGSGLHEAGQHAKKLAAEGGLFLVHPYDDPMIVAGAGTLGLEMLEDAPEIDALVIPVGGGGMIGGITLAARSLKPGIPIYGVQVEGYAAAAQRLAGRPVHVGGPTIAEGIAVRDTGEIPLAILRANKIPVLTVTEAAIERAVLLFAEAGRLVAEGAGAAGLAALLQHGEIFAGRTVGTVLCGGNIDTRALSGVLMRGLARDGRLLRMTVEISDSPGVLAAVTGAIATAGGNVVEVEHQRLFGRSSVRSAELELVVEARDSAHADV